MRTVVFHLYSEMYRNTSGKLADMLKQQKIRIWSGAWEDLTEQPEHILLVTDDREDARYAARRQMALIFCELPGETAFIDGADMILQGFEEIDATFLRGVYRRHHGIPWTIAETERLYIRESIEEDLAAFQELYRQDGMLDYLPDPGFHKEDGLYRLRQYIKNQYPFYGYGIWTVLEKKSGRVIGRAGLENREYQGETVLEIGYMIEKESQRKGYGEEAVRAVEAYAEKEKLAEELYAFIVPENRASIGLIEKMKYEKISDQTGDGLAVWIKKLGRNG